MNIIPSHRNLPEKKSSQMSLSNLIISFEVTFIVKIQSVTNNSKFHIFFLKGGYISEMLRSSKICIFFFFILRNIHHYQYIEGNQIGKIWNVYTDNKEIQCAVPLMDFSMKKLSLQSWCRYFFPSRHSSFLKTSNTRLITKTEGLR